jgi:hypothetical protein
MTSFSDGGVGTLSPLRSPSSSPSCATSSLASSPKTEEVIERSCCTRPPRNIPGCCVSEVPFEVEVADRLGQ